VQRRLVLAQRLGWKRIGILAEESWRRTAPAKLRALFDAE
jgi:hypothetical protein